MGRMGSDLGNYAGVGPGAVSRRRGGGVFLWWRRWRRKGWWGCAFCLALLLLGLEEWRSTPVEAALAAYRYSIVDWEVSHLPDKLVRRTARVFTGGGAKSKAEERARAEEFFRLGWELSNLRRELAFPPVDGTAWEEDVLRREIAAKEKRKSELQGEVEEIIEGRLSQVAAQEGLTWAGGVFPPVDTVFTSSPHLLVASPRDRIARLSDYLLNPGLDDEEKAALEHRVGELEPDWSVIVVNIGGLSVYPSVVADRFGLHNAVEITAHEWLHSWLFFRPLGRNFAVSGEMLTLNETVATIAGRELGDAVMEALTGEPVARPEPGPTPKPDPNPFDFQAEMRETRLRADELLAAGNIEEAEAYMEERRRVFVENGHLIRKLNQAYFAFYGTYATSAASVSPIGGQVEELRRRSGSVGEFLKTVAEFGTYQEFLDFLENREQGG